MKTKTITLYNFDELSEEAQEKAIQNLSDINVDHQWWEFIYDDAKQIGLQISEFDLDRNRYAKGKFLWSAMETAQLIRDNHGQQCETYKTAMEFLKQWDNEVAKHSDGIDTDKVTEEKEDDFDQIADELESDFLRSLIEDYSVILQKEYEYLTSSEAIIETIKANEYTFTETGKLEN